MLLIGMDDEDFFVHNNFQTALQGDDIMVSPKESWRES